LKVQAITFMPSARPRPGAQDAQGLALERGVEPAGPAPGLELGGLEGGALGDREHQAEHVLGDRRRGAPGLIGDHDAQLLGGREVDHVGADGAGGDHPELGQGPELGRAPAHHAARVDEDLGVPGARDLLVMALRPAVVERDLAIGREPRQIGRAGDLHRIVAGHDDSNGIGHGDFLLLLDWLAEADRGS
jgi:hypothetical protein